MLLDYLGYFEILDTFIWGNFSINASLLPKQVLLTKLACFNLGANFSATKLLNSWIVIYLAMSGTLFSTSLIFASSSSH